MLAKTKLTHVQQRAFDWILAYMQKEGRSPTLREIMKGLGYTTISPVQDVLGALRAKGVLDWEERRPRSIVLTGYRFELVPVAG